MAFVYPLNFLPTNAMYRKRRPIEWLKIYAEVVSDNLLLVFWYFGHIKIMLLQYLYNILGLYKINGETAGSDFMKLNKEY